MWNNIVSFVISGREYRNVVVKVKTAKSTDGQKMFNAYIILQLYGNCKARKLKADFVCHGKSQSAFVPDISAIQANT